MRVSSGRSAQLTLLGLEVPAPDDAVVGAGVRHLKVKRKNKYGPRVAHSTCLSLSHATLFTSPMWPRTRMAAAEVRRATDTSLLLNIPTAMMLPLVVPTSRTPASGPGLRQTKRDKRCVGLVLLHLESRCRCSKSAEPLLQFLQLVHNQASDHEASSLLLRMAGGPSRRCTRGTSDSKPVDSMARHSRAATAQELDNGDGP
jgi:hypothetical protein